MEIKIEYNKAINKCITEITGRNIGPKGYQPVRAYVDKLKPTYEELINEIQEIAKSEGRELKEGTLVIRLNVE